MFIVLLCTQVCWKDVIHWMWPLFTDSWGSWRCDDLNLSPCPFTVGAFSTYKKKSWCIQSFIKQNFYLKSFMKQNIAVFKNGKEKEKRDKVNKDNG